MGDVVLHDYWRSSASYRVRIALNHLGIAYRSVPVDILEGRHRTDDYLALNPQGLVPTLTIDGHVMTQSLAIIEYLAETRPDAGMLPADPIDRQYVRALSYAIAMDIHPICNSHVAAHVVELTGDPDARETWMRRFIGQGLANVERMLAGRSGRFCCGDRPTMADFCLVPQLYNARRWGADISPLSRILSIDAECAGLPAFAAAHPDNQRQPG
jgi:maleylacetoacetate isomerase